ncbi:MAG: hypothetical protein HND52_15400 [Ignavibacteriae bacterium]|nr:hypothetical protein [Ignavibacteriota bacterium]NOG99341.1 hypothetical protein [Ignavibacteriota bacterium]
MKSKIRIAALFSALFFFAANNLTAQSDYELTQKFKAGFDSLSAIADTLENLEQILLMEESVNNFKQEYLPHKELINNAYYPNTFSEMFAELEKKLKASLLAAQKVRSLSTEVVTLTQEKEILSKRVELLLEEIDKQNDYLNNLIQRNSRLAAELKELKGNPPEDKRARDSLETVVGRLKENLIERDKLVKSMLDSLFLSKHHQVSSLSEVEKKSLAKKIKEINVIENVKRIILDNIEFLETLTLEQADINELKSEYVEFRTTWKKIGNDVSLVYTGKKKYKDELAEINILLYEWGATIDLVIWKEVVNLFHSKKINIDAFATAEDFKNSLINYVDSQIRLIENDSEILHYNSYRYFADIWYDEFIPNWYPFLVEKKLLTAADKDIVENKIENWETIVEESTPWWIYAIIIIVILIIVAAVWNFLTKLSKFKKADEESESNETQ